MSEETKNTAQEEEATDTPVTEETVENEPEVVENGEAETEEIPVEDGDEEASQDDKKDSKSKTSFFGKKKKEKDKRYHKRHLALTGSNRGDRHNRDMLIDSSLLGVDGTAELIEEVAKKVFHE